MCLLRSGGCGPKIAEVDTDDSSKPFNVHREFVQNGQGFMELLIALNSDQMCYLQRPGEVADCPVVPADTKK